MSSTRRYSTNVEGSAPMAQAAVVSYRHPSPRFLRVARGRSRMSAGSKKQALRQLNFGNQVAEEERDVLRDYFVKTQAWDKIVGGEIDIVYGPKGSGKSALYVLLQDETNDLFDRGVLLVSGENPRGTPAFKDLVSEPPTTERDFISIWKLYV
jgi:ABC-type multidrug transport system fused ATPase/permease subunit